MKRLLLVSDEKTPQDQGKITDSARYGLAPELYNLPNLREAISRLTEREQKILRLRYYEGKTQTEISAEVGISQAQVSRLEKNALGNIRKEIS